jgi:hypothetical protein
MLFVYLFNFLKQYGQYKQYIIIALVAVAAVFYTVRQNNHYTKLIDDLNKSHATEIADLKRIQQEGERKQAESIARLNDELAQIDRKYADEVTRLEKEKAGRYKTLSNAPPIELAKRLSELTGFTITLGGTK